MNELPHEDRHEIPGMFQGPLRTTLLRLALPVLMGFIFNLAYTVCDTWFISSINPADPSIVGGAGLIFPLLFLAIALANGLMIGVASLVARAIGERSRDVLNRVADSGLFLAVIVGVTVVVSGYLFSPRLLNLMGAEGDYARHAGDYFRWLLPGLGLMLVLHVLIGVLQGEGQMKYMMRGMIFGNLLNIALDPFFIFEKVFFIPGLGLGVKGAALATVIGQSLAGLYIVWVFVSKKTTVPVAWKFRHVKIQLMKKIVAVGLPQTLSMIVMSFTFIILNRMVITIDPRGVTAFALCGRVDQLVILPLLALSTALMTVTGQNVGRGLLRRARQAWRTGILMGFVAVTITASLLVILAPLIYRGFTSDPVVLRYTILQTRIVEYSNLAAAVAILGQSVFQALGRPWPAFILTSMRMIGFALPLIWLFVSVLDWGIYGVWGGIVGGNLLSLILSLIWIHSLWNRLEKGTIEYSHAG